MLMGRTPPTGLTTSQFSPPITIEKSVVASQFFAGADISNRDINFVSPLGDETARVSCPHD